MSSPGEEYASEVARVASGRKKAKSLRPLRELLPFLKPFRARIAIAGIALGIAFSLAASWAIRHRFPLVQVMVTKDWIGWAMLVAVMGALVGALYPAFKAAGKDPIEALAYE